MIIKVPKGHYEVVEKRGVILKTDFLGSGIALGMIDKENEIAGLCHFVLPYKEHDLEIEAGELILSGQSLLPLFFEELENKGFNFSLAKIAIAGGSKYKNSSSALNIGEINFKVLQSFLLKYPINPENIILRVGFNCQSFLEVNLKEKILKINLNGEKEVL
jgi:chemotaxis protein CheD